MPKHTRTEDDETQDELISGFDKFGVQRCVKRIRVPGLPPQLTEGFCRSLHEQPQPTGPLVIPALKNRDWRVPEDEALGPDVKRLPDSSTLDDYTDMPVSEFGAAMLRGMGWTEGGKGKTNIQPWLPQSRPALLGIGAKEREVFDDGNKKKLLGKPDKKYIPVIKKERLAGSSASSRNHTPSPSPYPGSRRRTRSTSPGRKDRTPRDDNRRRDDDRNQDRGGGDEPRRDRDNDHRKDEDRTSERRRYRDDDRDRWRERDEDRRRDRNRDGHRRDYHRVR